MSEEATREARGLALMLLAAVGGGAATGYLLTLMHALYVPVVMPALAGVGLGILLALPRNLFGAGRPWQCAILVVMAGAIAYAAYHVVHFIQMREFLTERMTHLADVSELFEAQTGEQGWLAYLVFTSQGPHAVYISPFGQAARLEPSAGLVLSMLAADLVAIVAAAWFVLLKRTAGVAGTLAQSARPPGQRTRQIIARVDTPTLVAALHAIDEGKLEEAGRILKASVEEAQHAIAVLYDPWSEAPWDLEVMDTVPGAGMVVRASRTLSSWDGQRLYDELKAP